MPPLPSSRRIRKRPLIKLIRPLRTAGCRPQRSIRNFSAKCGEVPAEDFKGPRRPACSQDRQVILQIELDLLLLVDLDDGSQEPPAGVPLHEVDDPRDGATARIEDDPDRGAVEEP